MLHVLHLFDIIPLVLEASMKLYYDKRLSDPTYYVQIGIRKGKKVTSKNISKIGKHSELLKEHHDPLAYARSVVKKMNEEKDIRSLNLVINLEKQPEKSPDSFSHSTTLNIGYLILNQIYRNLGLNSYFHQLEKSYRSQFDMDQIFRFLTVDRILCPQSKLQTVLNLSNYFEKPSFDYQHVLRFMDVLSDHYEEYITYLYKATDKVITRDTTVCYYDCTNYYFEIERADEDIYDEYTGEIIDGFRKYGMSKEHRPNPLVQMGLFIDNDGIPLSMCLTSGNQSEQLTALPLEKKLIKMMENSDFIYCADAGLGSYPIRKFNSMGGRRFIVTQSFKKLPETLKKAIFNDYDYRLLSNRKPIHIQTMRDFDPVSNLSLYQDKAYKEIDASKELIMEFYEKKIYKNGKTRMVKAKATLEQKIIVTFSRKMLEYQRKIRNGQIERAKKLLKNMDPDSYKKGANDFRRFIKKENGHKTSYILDEDKIREEEQYDGYYIVATNVFDKDVKEILKISGNRFKIEECFRILKTDFSGRPINHRLKERIIAHFMICYTALLIYRLLEVQLDRKGTHLTGQQIIKTLKNMNVTDLDGLIYKSLYTNSEALEAMMKLIPLGLDKEYYLKPTLENLIHKTKHIQHNK